jgi:hypothetical protein
LLCEATFVYRRLMRVGGRGLVCLPTLGAAPPGKVPTYMYMYACMYVEMGGMGCLPCLCPVIGLMQGEIGIYIYWVARFIVSFAH